MLRLFTILFRFSELIAQLRSENIKLREKLEETEEKLEVIQMKNGVLNLLDSLQPICF